jgi:hypothetical protein
VNYPMLHGQIAVKPQDSHPSINAGVTRQNSKAVGPHRIGSVKTRPSTILLNSTAREKGYVVRITLPSREAPVTDLKPYQILGPPPA